MEAAAKMVGMRRWPCPIGFVVPQTSARQQGLIRMDIVVHLDRELTAGGQIGCDVLDLVSRPLEVQM